MTSHPRNLDIDGAHLEGRWIGPGPDEAPTLVLLHEGLGCVSLWLDFPERLAAATGCGVFVYSRAGYGASSPVPLPRPLSYMHDEARTSLPKVLAAIGFREGLIVGHSDGASIAAIYAGMHQNAGLRGLVLIAPHVFTEEMGLASIAEAKIAYEQGDLRTRLARRHKDVHCAFRGWNDAWLDPGFRSWNIEEYLPAIRVPSLIVQGEADQYGTIAQVEAIRRGSGGEVETLMLPGVGHSPHREATEATVAGIARFAGEQLKKSHPGA